MKNDIRLAINISNRQLFSRAFLPSLIDLITKYRIEPERLKLEITEFSALETDSAIHTLQALSDSGFYISLDDFGTGFSSLDHAGRPGGARAASPPRSMSHKTELPPTVTVSIGLETGSGHGKGA